jgi:uncharacterized membrane protein
MTDGTRWRRAGALAVGAALVVAATGCYAGLDVGGTESWGEAVSANGTVAGRRVVDGHWEVFVLPSDSPVHGTRMSSGGAVSGVTDTGRAVGYVAVPFRGGRLPTPMVWDNGGERALPMPDGDAGEADGVNESGTIVGIISPLAYRPRAVRWAPDGTVTNLAEPPGAIESRATGINGRGDIVGYAVTSDRATGLLWPAGSSAYVELAGGGHRGAQPDDISDDGVIVGRVQVDDSTFQAARWASRDAEPQSLGGGTHSRALAVDGSGAAAGFFTADDGRHAGRWPAGATEPVDLGRVAPAPADTAAAGQADGVVAVNARGDLIGTGEIDGTRRAVRFSY